MRRGYKIGGKVCGGGSKFRLGALLNYLRWYYNYNDRIIADGGTIQDADITKQILKVWQSTGLYSGMLLQISAEGGLATRDSGIEKYVTKAYDFSESHNDAGQTTEILQPFLGGRIAPNENKCFKSVYGANLVFSHTSIPVGETYTVIKVVNRGCKTSVSFTEVNSGSLDSIAWDGKLYLYAIYGGVISESKQSAIGTALLAVFHEFESVVIGNQEWLTSNCELVTTPMGNTMTEVTDNATWASSQTLYNNYLSANPGDTYGATQAAAMWCYYNNDLSLGAIYGKLYNWFAVSLIQQDIDLYNAANPTSHCGYHVPSQDEFIILADYLGGTSVAGGKMKVDGEDYWNIPNIGADNSCGFSDIGGGYRTEAGYYTALLINSRSWLISELSGTEAYRARTSKDNSILSISAATEVKIRGYSLRLIKD